MKFYEKLGFRESKKIARKYDAIAIGVENLIRSTDIEYLEIYTDWLGIRATCVRDFDGQSIELIKKIRKE